MWNDLSRLGIYLIEYQAGEGAQTLCPGISKRLGCIGWARFKPHPFIGEFNDPAVEISITAIGCPNAYFCRRYCHFQFLLARLLRRTSYLPTMQVVELDLQPRELAAYNIAGTHSPIKTPFPIAKRRAETTGL